MYYYFSGNTTSAIKINGVYLGLLGKSPKFINAEENPLIEILPLQNKGENLNFILNKEFLSSPPEFASVTDMDGGYLINLFIKDNKPDFYLYAQQKYLDGVITVFNENGVKISLEINGNFFAETIDYTFNKVEILDGFFNGEKIYFIAFWGDETLLLAYNSKCEKVLSVIGNSYSLNNGVIIVKEYKDVLKHKVETIYDYKNGEFYEFNKVITAKKNSQGVSEKILPYCFLEELLLGGDIKEYLSNEIIKEEDAVREYFGNFIGILPPPIFRDFNEIGLIYKTGDNTFRVKYAEFSLDNRKIVNFKIK